MNAEILPETSSTPPQATQEAAPETVSSAPAPTPTIDLPVITSVVMPDGQVLTPEQADAMDAADDARAQHAHTPHTPRTANKFIKRSAANQRQPGRYQPRVAPRLLPR